MLNLQSENYSTQQSSPGFQSNKNVHEHSNDISLLLFPKAVSDVSNELKSAEQSSLCYNSANNSDEKNINSIQPIIISNQQFNLNEQNTDISNHISLQRTSDNNFTVDFPEVPNKSVNFQEPLTLHINVDEDGDSLHSWRPNLSVDSLYSDLFLPSPMFENFQLSDNQICNFNAGYFMPKTETNSESAKLDPETYFENSMALLHGYPSQNSQFYDISSK